MGEAHTAIQRFMYVDEMDNMIWYGNMEDDTMGIQKGEERRGGEGEYRIDADDLEEETSIIAQTLISHVADQ